MTNKNKKAGSAWERAVANTFNDLDGVSARRVAGSGALGTILQEDYLKGDVRITVDGLKYDLIVEAKIGYQSGKHSPSKVMAFQKAWLESAEKDTKGVYNSKPVVICKFKGAKGEARAFLAMDLQVAVDLIERVVDMKRVIDEQEEENYILSVENDMLREKAYGQGLEKD